MGIDGDNLLIENRTEAQVGQGQVEEQGIPRKYFIYIGIGLLVILAIVILAVYFLLQPSTPTDRIRDVFIIFMALESLILGMVLIILVLQLARLTNLLQNEVKPILESTNETINTLRGTTAFLSENLVEPVMKLNEYVAALQQMVSLFGLGRKRTKTK